MPSNTTVQWGVYNIHLFASRICHTCRKRIILSLLSRHHISDRIWQVLLREPLTFSVGSALCKRGLPSVLSSHRYLYISNIRKSSKKYTRRKCQCKHTIKFFSSSSDGEHIFLLAFVSRSADLKKTTSAGI